MMFGVTHMWCVKCFFCLLSNVEKEIHPEKYKKRVQKNERRWRMGKKINYDNYDVKFGVTHMWCVKNSKNG